jgi:hypothetical protein
MTEDSISATGLIGATPEAVFAVLADRSTYASLDGTGWVRESLDGRRLRTAGQIFRMSPARSGATTSFPRFPPEDLDNSLSHLAEHCLTMDDPDTRLDGR